MTSCMGFCRFPSRHLTFTVSLRHYVLCVKSPGRNLARVRVHGEHYTLSPPTPAPFIEAHSHSDRAKSNHTSTLWSTYIASFLFGPSQSRFCGLLTRQIHHDRRQQDDHHNLGRLTKKKPPYAEGATSWGGCNFLHNFCTWQMTADMAKLSSFLRICALAKISIKGVSLRAVGLNRMFLYKLWWRKHPVWSCSLRNLKMVFELLMAVYLVLCNCRVFGHIRKVVGIGEKQVRY